MERNRLICGEALAALRKIPVVAAQLVVAELPCFQVLERVWDRQWPDAAGYQAWSLAWLDEAVRILWTGLLYCFGQLDKSEHTFLHLMSEAARRWQFMI